MCELDIIDIFDREGILARGIKNWLMRFIRVIGVIRAMSSRGDYRSYEDYKGYAVGDLTWRVRWRSMRSLSATNQRRHSPYYPYNSYKSPREQTFNFYLIFRPHR